MIISLTKYLINFLHVILIFLKFFYNLLFFSWLHRCAKKCFNSYCKEVRNIYKGHQPTGGGGLSKVDVTQLSNLKVIRIYHLMKIDKSIEKNKYESPNRRINYSFYIFILLILLQKQNLNVRKVYTDMMFKATFANVLYLIQILYWDIVVFFSWLNIS